MGSVSDVIPEAFHDARWHLLTYADGKEKWWGASDDRDDLLSLQASLALDGHFPYIYENRRRRDSSR